MPCPWIYGTCGPDHPGCAVFAGAGDVDYWLNFDRTWPALLIVIGLVSFLRHSAPIDGHVPREYVPYLRRMSDTARRLTGRFRYGQAPYAQAPIAPAASATVVTPAPIQPGGNLPAPYQRGGTIQRYGGAPWLAPIRHLR